MANYTFSLSTTNAQEKGLTFVVAQENARRAALEPPDAPITAQAYMQARLDDLVTKYRKAYKDDLRTRVAAALDDANNATVAQVAGILGVSE